MFNLIRIFSMITVLSGFQSAMGSIVSINIDNAVFFSQRGNPNNTYLFIDIPLNEQIVGVSWFVNLTTLPDSRGDEATIEVNGQGFQNLFIRPAVDRFGPVDHEIFFVNGFIMLEHRGIDPIVPFADGQVIVSLYDSFIDDPDAPDAWLSPISRLTFLTEPIPSPGVLATLSLTGILAARRRR